MFRTQSALQDRDQNLTCSEVDAELGAKNIVVELNFHDVKAGNFSIACSPIPRKYRFDECILQDGDVDGKYSPGQIMLSSANKFHCCEALETNFYENIILCETLLSFKTWQSTPFL